MGEGFRNIPIRCYTPEKPLLQRLIRPMDDTTGTWTTLQDAMLEFFPGIVLSQSVYLIYEQNLQFDLKS